MKLTFALATAYSLPLESRDPRQQYIQDLTDLLDHQKLVEEYGKGPDLIQNQQLRTNQKALTHFYTFRSYNQGIQDLGDVVRRTKFEETWAYSFPGLWLEIGEKSNFGTTKINLKLLSAIFKLSSTYKFSPIFVHIHPSKLDKDTPYSPKKVNLSRALLSKKDSAFWIKKQQWATEVDQNIRPSDAVVSEYGLTKIKPTDNTLDLIRNLNDQKIESLGEYIEELEVEAVRQRLFNPNRFSNFPIYYLGKPLATLTFTPHSEIIF